MKKSLIITIILLAAILLFNPCVNAKEKDNINILSSSGTATTYAEPDTVVITFATETENKILTKATKENTAKAKKIISEIKKLLGKDDSIKTTSFKINPVYIYDKTRRKRILSGYKVTNKVNIKTKKINDAGKFISTAISCGANRVENINFIIEDKNKYSDFLLKQATETARQKASVVADTLGLCITGVKKASVNFSDGIIRQNYARAYASEDLKGMAAGEASSVPIESGKIKLRATVSVDFIIKNK